MKPSLLMVLLAPVSLLGSGCFHVTASDAQGAGHGQRVTLPPPSPAPVAPSLPTGDTTGASFPGNLDGACSAGEQTSCVGLAVLYWEGAGVAQERTKARGMLERACQAGEESGCSILAALTGRRAGFSARVSEVPLGPEAEADSQVLLGTTEGPRTAVATQAAELMKRLCDQGNMEGCAGLGSLYWKGLGVPKDKEMSRQLLKRACDGGDSNGCTLLQVFAKEDP